MSIKKTLLATAVTTAMGATAIEAQAAPIMSADWTGLFTILTNGGTGLQNNSYPYYGDPTWGYGFRTQLSGTMTFDLATGSGSATVNDFDFFQAGLAEATTITMQVIDPNNGLVQANMGFNWNGNVGIPVSLIMDARGFFGALQSGFATSTVIDQTTVAGYGAVPASDGMNKGKFPIGPVPMASTSLDTALISTASAACAADVSNGLAEGNCLGLNPSSEPFVIAGDDGIGGSPMIDGPFGGFNANFDITSVHITDVNPIPVPAAVWLFGSGLVGLAGV
ncbi:MAG TPA: hypothetical protein EYN01_04060, partial [Chromatiales bacterium]|nr:hypothetical protein [Chromatiales bacterium]